MQGIFIDNRRPKSKKEIRETIETDPSRVCVEATSMFGNEFDGSVENLAIGSKVLFVGPDPYTKRAFYGSIVRTASGLVVK